ncbi:uncharacterized protein ACMZJ9_014456 [Mantella aurantiaca]
MEEDRSHMTERILDLTLEIIYLLIGEECIIAKKSSGDQVISSSLLGVSQRCSRKLRSKMESSTHSLIAEINNDEKILEVTQKIIVLLTGEVPIRCQDVTVYFSMEEWEYLEGHKDLYTDGNCVGNLKTSQIEEGMRVNTAVQQKKTYVPRGGSIGKNTQQGCLNPLNSRDSTREPHEASHDDQRKPQWSVKAGATGRVEDAFLRLNAHKKRGCQLNVKAAGKGKEGDNILRFDMLKKQEHPFSIKSEATAESVENKFLRMAVQMERKCPLSVKAEGKGSEGDSVLRTEVQKEKREHPSIYKAEDAESAEDACLRMDVQKERKCQLNVKPEGKGKEGDNVLRTNLHKEKREHPFNIKAEGTERVNNIFLRTDLQKDHGSQLNVKAEIKEDRFLRTNLERNEPQFNVLTELAETQGNKLLGTDVEWEDPGPRSSNKNTQTRHPTLCHWDSTGEQKKILRDEKGERLLNIKVEVMESDDETYLWRDVMSKEDDFSTDGSNSRNTPEKCRSPLYSWDSPLENHKILSSYQEERTSQRHTGGRVAPEKMHGRSVEESKEDDVPPEIGTDGRYMGYNMEKCPMIFPDGEMEDDITGDSFEETPTGANFFTIPHSLGQPPGPSAHAGSFRSHFPPVTNRTYRRRGETFMCSECGECFTAKAKLFKHQRDHIVDKPHSCPDCGKCFVEKSHLVNHQRSHSVEKPYSCSICGKCFGEKGHLANHEKSHANEKEFFCYECGKCFTQRGHFNRHQRLHTGEKPYPCPECGKCFPHREYLIRHQRVHAGQKPFPCSECGKCFTDKYDLAKHERIHSGHRPYSCPECGRGFTQKSNLARHVRVHADYNRIHVLTVGNGSPGEAPSSTISVPMNDAKFLYQDMTAE